MSKNILNTYIFNLSFCSHLYHQRNQKTRNWKYIRQTYVQRKFYQFISVGTPICCPFQFHYIPLYTALHFTCCYCSTFAQQLILDANPNDSRFQTFLKRHPVLFMILPHLPLSRTYSYWETSKL